MIVLSIPAVYAIQKQNPFLIAFAVIEISISYCMCMLFVVISYEAMAISRIITFSLIYSIALYIRKRIQIIRLSRERSERENKQQKKYLHRMKAFSQISDFLLVIAIHSINNKVITISRSTCSYLILNERTYGDLGAKNQLSLIYIVQHTFILIL